MTIAQNIAVHNAMFFFDECFSSFLIMKTVIGFTHIFS